MNTGKEVGKYMLQLAYNNLLQRNKSLTYPGFYFNLNIPLRGISFNRNSSCENDVVFHQFDIKWRFIVFVQSKAWALRVGSHPIYMLNAIGSSCESNPSRRIRNLRAVPLSHVADNNAVMTLP